MNAEPVKRRAYDSPERRAAAQATRQRICEAAAEFFVGRGYARTSIHAVAVAAGVSDATVYLAFKNKAALLDACILAAIGEARGSANVHAAPPAEALVRFAEVHAAVMARAAPLIAIGEGAAAMDADLRPLQERAHDGLRTMMLAIADRLDEAGLLRAGLAPTAAAATMFAVASDATFLRWVESSGEAGDGYAAWLADTLGRLVLRG